MIKVLDLLKDGIWLAEGDIVCDGSETTKVNNLHWEGKTALAFIDTGRFDGWYVKEFTKRKNTTGERPVPDWVKVDVTDNFNSKADTDLASRIDFKYSLHPADCYWKPNMEFLVEHYNKDEESTVKEEPTPERVIYTKEMFDKGVLPQKGMLCYTNIRDQGMLIISKVSFKIEELEGQIYAIVEITFDGGIQLDLDEVIFPEPLTLKETVIAAMVDKHDNMNTDYLSTEQVMEKYYDVMLEVSEVYVG